jgi:cobalt-zinc-cadmium efflux system outer membrane protein
MTLDQAVELLVHENLTLKSKSFEIPQARADVLTASLRANPLFYADSQLIPYDKYSASRPGGPTQYDVNISHPIDYSRKRRARMQVAGRAVRVIEAQYQDAVRIEINNLYILYVDVLAARQALRYANASVSGLEELLRATSRLKEIAEGTSPAVSQIRGQLELARIGAEESEELLRRARRALATVLNVPPGEAEQLEVRGVIEDFAPPPPSEAELTEIALNHRPDVVSYQLGVQLAQANHGLMRANRYSDAYLLYQPYTYQNNAPFGKQSATSWAIGLTVPLPVYNRNQGNIERARLNITQSQIDLASLQRQVVTEIQQAISEYQTSGRTGRRVHEFLIPEARKAAHDQFKRFEGGEIDVTAFLDAQRAYNDTVKQYLDTAIRHRRSMLALNTAVGRRIMP